MIPFLVFIYTLFLSNSWKWKLAYRFSLVHPDRISQSDLQSLSAENAMNNIQTSIIWGGTKLSTAGSNFILPMYENMPIFVFRWKNWLSFSIYWWNTWLGVRTVQSNIRQPLVYLFSIRVAYLHWCVMLSLVKFCMINFWIRMLEPLYLHQWSYLLEGTMFPMQQWSAPAILLKLLRSVYSLNYHLH